jgi:hypothetical protein
MIENKSLFLNVFAIDDEEINFATVEVGTKTSAEALISFLNKFYKAPAILILGKEATDGELIYANDTYIALVSDMTQGEPQVE